MWEFAHSLKVFVNNWFFDGSIKSQQPMAGQDERGRTFRMNTGEEKKGVHHERGLGRTVKEQEGEMAEMSVQRDSGPHGRAAQKGTEQQR